MIIQGVAMLSACFLAGTLLGEALGGLLGIDANVGGVGFAMLLLIFVSDGLRRKGRLPEPTRQGVLFWSAMYIPIVVAMAMIQDVAAAMSGGLVAILAGAGATLACLLLVPLIGRIGGREAPLDPQE